MWHTQRTCCTVLVVACLGCGSAAAQQRLTDLPDPIRAYAEQFEPYCAALKKPGVVANEMYSDRLFGAPDINHDGKRDYFEYKCMFGCNGVPFAFVGMEQPCPFGALLLSTDAGYQAISIPGTITQLDSGPPITIAVTRWRINLKDCGDELQCSYLFELREGRFQLITPCPSSGCKRLVSGKE